MVLRKMIENLLQFLIQALFLIITFHLTWCMHIQSNDNTPATSQNYIWHSCLNTPHNPATDILHSPAYEDGTDSEFRNVGN